MEHHRSLLKSLLGNHLDRVTIIYHLQRLKQVIDEDAPFAILKYKLQLELVEIIAKESPGDNYIATLKKETNDYLKFHQQKVTKICFKCCLVGCIYKTTRHRNYMRHLKQSHSQNSNLSCQFGFKCEQTFSSISVLSQHVDHVHKTGRRLTMPGPAPVDIPCKCVMVKCSGKQFPNTRLLMLHLRNDHAGEMITCIFESCNKRFDNTSSLRDHFSSKHLKCNLFNLKTSNKVHMDHTLSFGAGSSLTVEALPTSDVEVDEPLDDLNDAGDYGENVDTNDDDDYFMMTYCDFLNRLANFQFIPQSTIQIIGEQFLKNYKTSNEVKSTNLRVSLEKSDGMSKEEIDRIIKDVEKHDDFLDAQQTLDSEYKRKQFLKDNFVYVPPDEIVMNPKEVKEKKAKDVVHYVNIIESFKHLVQDSSFVAMEEKNVSPANDSILRDLKDGELYKNNSYFQQNPQAYTMMIYSDAIELVNPLGAGRGKHKVIQIFFSLCEISKHLRSKIDRIVLVAVFKEKLIKKYGFKKIYEKLVEDLKVLEDGILIDYPVRRLVKCGVLIHPSDNLEAHAVGGFSQSFSSGDVCRFCHIRYVDLIDNIHDFGPNPHAKWNVVEYDRAARFVEERNKAANDLIEDECDDESDDESVNDSFDAMDVMDAETGGTADGGEEDPIPIELFGVNSLKSFHSTSGFPPDVLHDLFEGKSLH